MPIRLIPVGVAKLGVDLHINRPAHGASILDLRRFDAFEDRCELVRFGAEAVVMDRQRIFRFNEVQRQAIVDIDRGKWPRCCFSPGDTKKLRKKFCGSNLGVGRHYEVVKLYRHGEPSMCLGAPYLRGSGWSMLTRLLSVSLNDTY